MSGSASRNQGIQMIASFDDRAVPLSPLAGSGRPGTGSRSANEGVRFFAAFEDDVRPLNGPEPGALDALTVLFPQHEQEVHRLVHQLQGMIEDLKKQNSDLRRVLLNKDQLIGRYHLDGPNEDEI